MHLLFPCAIPFFFLPLERACTLVLVECKTAHGLVVKNGHEGEQ
jgi:hypothetical protein